MLIFLMSAHDSSAYPHNMYVAVAIHTRNNYCKNTKWNITIYSVGEPCICDPTVGDANILII